MGTKFLNPFPACGNGIRKKIKIRARKKHLLGKVNPMSAKDDLNKQATKPMRNQQSHEQDNKGTGSLLMEEAGQLFGFFGSEDRHFNFENLVGVKRYGDWIKTRKLVEYPALK